MDGRVIRRFGNWELVLVDLGSSEKVYINVETKELSEDPPEEVLEILEAENRQVRLPVYEFTPYSFAPVCGVSEAVTCSCCCGVGSVAGLGECPLCDGAGCLEETGHSGSSVVEKTDFLECDGCAFLMSNLLSHAECRNIIEQAELCGLKSCGYKQSMRITDRVSIMGEDLACTLFERARPFLTDIDVSRCGGGRLPLGIRDDARPGTWTPVGLNPCFRICRYEPGGFFLPHKDGGFEYSDEVMSLKTFMIYLNDGFEGAPTNFFKQSQACYAQPDPSKIIHELVPETGACVAFNHQLVHNGGVLRAGTKYILRTEVMYKWIDEDSDFD